MSTKELAVYFILPRHAVTHTHTHIDKLVQYISVLCVRF